MRRFQSGRRLMMIFIGLLTCFYPFLFLESFFCRIFAEDINKVIN